METIEIAKVRKFCAQVGPGRVYVERFGDTNENGQLPFPGQANTDRPHRHVHCVNQTTHVGRRGLQERSEQSPTQGSGPRCRSASSSTPLASRPAAARAGSQATAIAMMVIGGPLPL